MCGPRAEQVKRIQTYLSVVLQDSMSSLPELSSKETTTTGATLADIDHSYSKPAGEAAPPVTEADPFGFDEFNDPSPMAQPRITTGLSSVSCSEVGYAKQRI